jgi:prepilin-type N-terminal cleavage/methylation domain-containing protein
MQNLKSLKKDILRVLTKYFRMPRPESQSGYLLIELLVAMTVFSIIVIIAVGSFVNVLRTQRQVAALSAAESNLGIVMEEMAREMRTGYLFCTNTNGTLDSTCGCSPFESESGSEEVCSDLKFTNAEGDNVEYFLNTSGTLEKSVNVAAPQEITGNNVKVKYFNFILFGNTPGDHWNPRVTITVGIHPNDAALSGNVLNLETTVSARQIDCTSGTPSSSPQC